jgi:Putative Flp pilus-assembly TadE/G-like
MIRSAPALVGQPARRGTVVPLLALTMVALIGFLALAIDVGMLAIAKAQAQQSADLAALTAARTLNGNATGTYNQSAATKNAQNILSYNVILGQAIQSSQLALTYGSYDYNQTTQAFNANYPATSGAPYSAVAATVTASSLPGAFSTVWGNQFLPSVTATAQAVHRPRDVALVMDLSGSMRMGTCLGFDFVTNSRTTNNPDTLVPTFGQYSSASSGLIGTSSSRTSSFDSYTISPSNHTAANSSYSLTYVNNFYQNAAYAATLVRAFDSYTSTDGGNTWTAPTSGTPQLPPSSYATTQGGDVPLFKNGSTTTYATTVNDVVGSTSANTLWELDGYSAYSAGKPDTSGTGGVPKVWTQADYSSTPFYGYTKGPGYYGKTFFMWPPDPRNTIALPGATAPTSTQLSTLISYLNLLGVTGNSSSGDAYVLSNIWSTWQAQGVGPGSTGLTNLQNWLKGTAKGGASSLPTYSGTYYSATPTSSTAFVTGLPTSWNGTTLTTANKPQTYYAVCRLFNWAYPAGSSWSGTTLSTGTSYSADWRLRFFNNDPSANNTVIFNSSGSLNTPSSSGYQINYNAILAWLTQTNDPFPQQMRAGRVKYYGSIPTAITGTWPSYGSKDQQFWVEVIDYTLGFRQTASGVYTDISAMAGYGSDFTWGTVKINTPPASATQYMNYSDNPARGYLRYWFGPLLMTDYLQNFNMWVYTSGYYSKQPGDSYEAPVYTAKQAFLAAVNTMENNHPNDWFTLVPFSWPRTGSSGADWPNGANTVSGRFNCVSCPLGTNYNYGSSALVFPFSTINADGSPNSTEITPYDADPATGQVPSANFVDTPRADGETCFAMALMLCYNQFAVTPSTDSTLRTYVTSSPITFPTGMAGGLGRKGAQKVIIFETDGIPNTTATAPLTSGGSYNYYSIRYNMNSPGSSEYPTATNTTDAASAVTSQIQTLVTNLQTTYGTTRNPFRLYTIGFGPVFQGADASSAQTVLQNMQYWAGTQSSASTALPSSQIITGTGAQMSANMIAAYTSILQNGVQVALIK